MFHAIRTTSDEPTYYDAHMASVRLDAEREALLERAAALRGESKSDFIRAAVDERVQATLGDGLADRLAHLIGQVDLGGGRAERAHELAGERVRSVHAGVLERGPRRR
jgi:Protein of unknown function (DUF1778)